MKRIFCTLLALILLLAISSCSPKKSYNNGIGCAQLYDGIADGIGENNQYLEFDSLHTEMYFPNTEEYDDCHTVYSSNVNDINEIGIFHAPDEPSARALQQSCEAYISDMQENSRAFISSYAPEELPKLDGAQVHRFGNYVVYLILPDTVADEVLEKIEGMLLER